MIESGPERSASLAERIDLLFRLSRPAGRFWTNDEVAVEVKRIDPSVRASGAYLSALRNGKRTNPSQSLLSAVCRFFGVPDTYLTDQQAAGSISQQLAVLDTARRTGVHAIALRAVGLNDESLATVAAVLDHIRELQGLPPVDEPVVGDGRGVEDSDVGRP
ncbi:helix-turn-helix domain-containing protein [Nocardia sp. NPDC052566]|uniref:helix-turn-helix domain-containing protein n=1 Tax=Nocardia sp. NPDC052566 TaxID=3364330 RepID=UPI0037C61B7E